MSFDHQLRAKRVMHLVASSDEKRGGVTKAVFTLINGLNSLDIDNVIVSLDDPEADYLSNRDIPVIALGPTKTSWQHSSKLSKWLDDNICSFDYVIIHGMWLYPNFAVRQSAGRLKGKSNLPKIFVMPHGMLDPYFQESKSRKLKAIRNLVYWHLIEKGNTNSFEGLLFTCESEKILAKQPFAGYQPKSEIVIGFGVEDPPPHSNAMDTEIEKCYPSLADSKYLLFLSRIDPKKGLHILIKGYKKYLDENGSQSREGSAETNNPPLKLLIAGPAADENYLTHLKNEVSGDAQLSSHVTFLGMLSGDAKWGAFYNCEAFILPSHQENFGIAVVEALACNKPVLISSKINIHNEIAAGGGGLVVDDTADGVHELITRFSTMSSEDVLATGNKARQTYLKEFYAMKPSVSLKDIL